MKRATAVLLLATLLPACGLLEKLKSRTEKTEAKQEEKSPFTPGEPVPHEKLKQLLPRMEGWDAQPPRSALDNVGEYRITRASENYQKKVEGGGQTVDLEIVDGNFVSDVYAPLALMAHASGGVSDVHKRGFEIEGHPAIEEWKPEARSVTLIVVVARRFLVTLKGTNLTPEIVGKWVQSIEWKKLAALGELKKPPAAP